MKTDKKLDWAKSMVPLMFVVTIALIIGGFLLWIAGQEKVGAVVCIVIGALGLSLLCIGAILSSHSGRSVGACILVGVLGLAGGVLVCGALALILDVMLLQPVLDLEHYRKVWDQPVAVTATVVKHEAYDNDGDEDYRSVVRYEYDGKVYTTNYESRDHKEDLTPLEEAVAIQISPLDPSRRMAALKSNGYGLLFGALILFAAGAGGCSALHRRNRSGDKDFPDTQQIRRDIRAKIRSRFWRPFWLLCWMGYGLIGWRYWQAMGIIPLLLGGACFLGWLVCMYTTLRDYRCAAEDLELHRDVLVDKTHLSDSDGDTYVLEYRNGERIWKCSTSERKYKRASIGETVLAVYFPGRKKPMIHYDLDGS